MKVIQLLLVLLLVLAELLSALPNARISDEPLDRTPPDDAEGEEGNYTGQSNCAVGAKASTQLAINELFTCLLTSFVEPTEAFRKTKGLSFHGIAGNGVTQAPLLKGPYSVASLLKSAEAESYQRYFDVSTVFNIELGRNEVRGPVELAKLNAYMSFLEKSPYVRDTYKTLVANRALNDTGTLTKFVRGTMYDFWFKQYARTARGHQSGLRDSSGFGHVFVGEVKGKEVTGFHNWLQLLSSEEANTFEYKGYVRVMNSTLLIGGIQFNWLGRSKPISSLIIGVPPEFEIALYTACLVTTPGRKCSVSIKGQTVSVQTFLVDHQPESVATAYPLV